MRHPSVNPLFWVISDVHSVSIWPPAERALVCRGAVSVRPQAYPSIVCMSAMRTNSEFSACR